MRQHIRRTILLCCVFFFFSLTHEGQAQEKTITIGVSPAQPFIILGHNYISGVCVDLWKQVADSLNINYSFKTYPDYLSLMEAMRKGEFDLTINPVTLTDYRLGHYRMSIPFYSSRLAIAERNDPSFPVFRALKLLIHWKSLRLVLMLLVVVLLFSVLIWLAERRNNHQDFRKGFKGIIDGIWWAFVTMTTVGYGDKVPRSKVGRMLTIVWMFYAIALFFLVTAEISSELTVVKLQSDISSIDDLKMARVGTLSQTGYASLCEINEIPFVPFTSLDSGLQAVVNKDIEMFLYDAIVLEYFIGDLNLTDKIVVTPSQFSEQYFCFAATKEYTSLIDQINIVILNIMESSLWPRILEENHVTQ